MTMDKNGIDTKRLLKESKKLILSSDSNDISKGLRNLKKVIKNDPENVWAFIYYGVGASKNEKNVHEAVAAFETASQISPDSVECWKGMRTCLEARNRSDHETRLLVKAYFNQLRLEGDMDKWKVLYEDIKASASKSSISLVVSVLSTLIEDYSCKTFKHEIACKEISTLAFIHESLLETNLEDVLRAFESWANFLDFSDRPEFCKKVCSYLTKNKYFKALSDFLYHTILVYGTKLYLKIQLMQHIIDISFDCLDNVEKLIPLVKAPLKEVENVKSFNQIKLALCIVHFFEEDFTMTREHLENLSCMGDVNATLFLLKFLCKAKDYEGVLFLCVRFARAFASINNEKLKLEFILCLLEALSSSNEVFLLEYAVKLGLKTFSKYGENRNLFYHLGHSYLGLQDSKAVFFLDKLQDSDDAKYLTSLFKKDASGCSTDLDKWLPGALLTANFDLINNNIKRALKNFTKVGVKDKCVSEPFLVLGIDSLAKGDISRAASCFHRAFSLRPFDAEILKYYLDSLFKLDDEQRALQVIDSVWMGNFGKWHLIGEKALFASGLIHSAKYDHEKSIRSFKHLMKLNPDCLEFTEAIADEYIRLGRLGIAENYVSRLVSEDPYDLHPLLLLGEIYKLDVNYSAYFNHSLNCLNFNPNENEEALKVSKLTLCFFINFLKQNFKLEDFAHNYISNLGVNALKKIEHIVTKGITERSVENEYLIALYKYIESHFLAAVKMMKLKGKLLEGKQLLNMCIEAIGRVMEIYGANYISFWKLLGDVLLLSSQLPFEIKVFAWLVKEEDSKDENEKFIDVSSSTRINLATKCYAVALSFAKMYAPSRMHEFFYDIGVSLILFANHPETVDPKSKYTSLKASLESCLKSFVHSDGISESRWIHSNLLGVIVSLLGVRDNMFKEHFSIQELKMKEALMLQNYATHLAKTGLFNHAEETFEQARLRVDMDYSSSWVGQLLMQLINNDNETKKMLQYNLTQIGNHPLFKWILAYYLAKNRPGLNFHGGQYSMLNYIFSEEECLTETNPSRLTLMAYMHELIGNTSIARRLYFKVLRLARHVDEYTYNCFLANAIRLNPHCRLNYDLIELLDTAYSPAATVSLYHLSTRHLSILNPNKFVLLKAIIIMKHLLNLLSSHEENTLALVVPLLSILNDINLLRYIDERVPFILEFLVKNIIVTMKRRKNEFRQIISTMDNACRVIFLKNIQKFVTLNKFNNSSTDLNCFKTNSSVTTLVNNPISKLKMINSPKENLVDWFSMSPEGMADNSTSKSDSQGSKSPRVPNQQENVAHSKSDVSCPYSTMLTGLRGAVFPLPLSDEEKLLIKRKKILRIQSSMAPQPQRKTFKTEEGSYLNLMEPHGCHSNCNLLFSLLRKSVSIKDYDSSQKYAHLCLDIKCTSCLQNATILPLISYISMETNNVRLIQKALHLYPSHPLLRKTTLWFLSRISG